MSNNSLQTNIRNFAGGIQSNKYISSITNALMAAFPVTMVGAIASLLNGLPIQGYQSFLTSSGLKVFTAIPSQVTNDLLALYVVYLIAAKFVESFDMDGTAAGVTALMAFFIVTPFHVAEDGLSMISLDKTWMGATGLFTAFMIGLLVGKIYTLCVQNNWVIKMPAGVPPTVSKSFTGLIPAFIVLGICLLIRGGLAATPFGNIHTLIFGLVATPLRALGGNIIAMLIAVIAGHILWLFGIHGTMVVYVVFAAIWTPLGIENLAAYNAGNSIPNLISMALFMQAISMGSGQTLGLAYAMLRSKSKRYKTLGGLAIIPNACGINEPIIFGTPVVMNFKLAIPFILTPVITVGLAYVLMLVGVLNKLPGFAAPLGTPIIISGFLSGGWRWAVYQLFTIVISYLMYMPFFRPLEREAIAQEAAEAEMVVA